MVYLCEKTLGGVLMRIRYRYLLVALVTVLGLGLPACRQSEVREAISPLHPQSPLPIPTTAMSQPSPPLLQVPTPAAGLGVVRGQLVGSSPSSREFLAGEIYLAPLVYAQGATPIPFVRLKPDEDPRATLRNEANEFVIVDVPPGKYGIVIHTPLRDYVVPDEEGGFLIIEVQEGKIFDLGVIELP